MYEHVKKTVLDSGLWKGSQRLTHEFVLSPDVYTITEAEKNELESLGRALHECLSGLGRIMAITENTSLARTNAWKKLGSVLRTGIPAHYRNIQIHKPGQLPVICKVDLMKTADGRFAIAEVDGHNKHGLGYSVLCARMRDAVAPDGEKFVGVAKVITDEVHKRGHGDLTLLYAEQERFYIPEFQILADELAPLGVKLVIQPEGKLTHKKLDALENSAKPQLFVDFPFLYHNPDLNELLPRMYEEGKVDFLYPPKPFLSSKTLLAILRNDHGDPDLEAILCAFISPKALAELRAHIPATYLVSKGAAKNAFAYYQDVCRQKTYVLKEVISSGMHGTIFTDDPNFEEMLKEASGSYNRFILQEEVTNAPHEFSFYADEGTVERATWFLRIIALYTAHSIADIDITARQDKRVHGAKDCLQLGTVIIPNEERS